MLKRLANTNEGFQTRPWDSQGQYLITGYHPNSLTGRYYEASTPGAIAAAFQQVESGIPRLSM